jgi:sterol desaturase/sphingolipid hydroxylase (fatty acid hydroxylase superfamily)
LKTVKKVLSLLFVGCYEIAVYIDVMISQQQGYYLCSIAVKVVAASYLLTLDALSDIPFITVWTVYFLLAATLTLYLKWQPQYLLIAPKWSVDDLISQANNSAFDLLFLLPISVVGANWFNLRLTLTEPGAISDFYSNPWCWARIPLGIFIGLICRMAAHRALHLPYCYKSIHKIHHIVAERMTPFSAFNDHPIEFFLMEVIGTFLLPCVLQPLPPPVLGAVWSLQVALGVCDHSNAIVPGSFFIDAEYHLVHHTLTNWNYAEFQMLDELWGTLYKGDLKWRKPQPVGNVAASAIADKKLVD